MSELLGTDPTDVLVLLLDMLQIFFLGVLVHLSYVAIHLVLRLEALRTLWALVGTYIWDEAAFIRRVLRVVFWVMFCLICLIFLFNVFILAMN